MARFTAIPSEDAKSLPIDYLRNYVLSRGWQRDAEASWELGKVFRLGDSEIVLPARMTVVDYAARVMDAILVLADQEQRYPVDVYRDVVMGQSADVVRFRHISALSITGTMPLDEGVRLVQNAREAMIAVAHSAVRPQGYFSRMGFKEVTELISQFRLGQTERGSYVASIVVPVPPAISANGELFPENIVPEDEPLARRTTRLLMVALSTIRKGLDENNLDGALKGIEQGVSGNLCEAVERMLPPVENAEVEISVGWAKSRRIAQNAPSRVSVRSTERGVFTELAKRFREHVNPEEQVLRGKIVSLKGDLSLFEAGTVAVRLDSRRQVLMTLSLEQFKVAIGAYGNEQLVEARGKLHQDGKALRLDAVSSFVVVQR